jgi:hypothetical protein
MGKALTRVLGVAVLVIGMMSAQQARACGFFDWNCQTTDPYGYDYSAGQDNTYYQGSQSDGTWNTDTYVQSSGGFNWSIVNIYYDQDGNDSGSTISSNGCTSQYDSDGQYMGQWGSC